MMRAASSSPVAWMWSRHGAIAVMPCFRHASTPSFRPNCWRTVARLIERPSVFMNYARCALAERELLVIALKSGIGPTARPGVSSDPIAIAPSRIVTRTLLSRAMIEVRMRGEERVLLRLRHARHAVDVMMPVALDMRRADQGREREILLHRDAGLRGQVLGRHEVAAGLFAVPFLDARAVDQRAVEALAGFRRDAAIAERAGARERFDVGIRLVDLDRHLVRQRLHRRRQRAVARDRLLDEDDRGLEPREARLLADAAPQRGDLADVVILLVAVERRLVGLAAIDHRRDAARGARCRRRSSPRPSACNSDGRRRRRPLRGFRAVRRRSAGRRSRRASAHRPARRCGAHGSTARA